MTTQSESVPECCPEFDPTRWHDKALEWINKNFIRDHVFTVFYMPLNFGKVMKKLDEKVTRNGANIPDWLCLSDHTSIWNMDLYLAIDKEIPDADNTILSGKFYCRVYEGPFRDSGKWQKDFKEVAESKGYTTKKMYMWYTTCPKCAKKYGKNYVAILSQVD